MAGTETLSRRERQIMDVIYAAGAGGATAEDVEAGLDDAPTRTAVRTFLRILEEKKLLRHEKRGRAFVYHPTRAPAQAGKSAFRRVVETFFGGSLEQALAAHLTDPSAKMTREEYQRIAALIENARRKGA
jgi:predicted transcriptional regulator